MAGIRTSLGWVSFGNSLGLRWGWLLATTGFVFESLRIYVPVSQRAERLRDSGGFDLDDDFVPGFEPKLSGDLAAYHNHEGRTPPADPGSDA